MGLTNFKIPSSPSGSSNFGSPEIILTSPNLFIYLFYCRKSGSLIFIQKYFQYTNTVGQKSI